MDRKLTETQKYAARNGDAADHNRSNDRDRSNSVTKPSEVEANREGRDDDQAPSKEAEPSTPRRTRELQGLNDYLTGQFTPNSPRRRASRRQ